MILDPTMTDPDFKDLQDPKKEDPLVEIAARELENQLSTPKEKVIRNEALEKPDITLKDLDITDNHFSEEKVFSTEDRDTERNNGPAQIINEKIDATVNEIKNIFPEFKNALIQLESVDFKTNGVYTEKLTTLADKCNATIKKLINLSKNEDLLIKQIGILTIIEKTSRSLVKTNDLQMIDELSSIERFEASEEIGMKILANMDALEKAVCNL